MAKFSLRKLPEHKRIQMIGEFYDAIAALKNRTEVRLFFRDLLTPDEIAMLMRRVEIAILLSAGFTYEQIGQLLGVGKAKITNVQRALLRHGEGYRIVTKRLLDVRRSRLKKIQKYEKAGSSIFENLKQKYPLHFLLFNLIDEIGELLEAKNKKPSKAALLKTPSARF